MKPEASPRFTFTQRIVLAVVPRIVWALFSLVGLTWRFEVIAEEGVTPLLGGLGAGAEIYCFWHQCVLPCTIYFRRTSAIILISRSFDGELITRILRCFGFRCRARLQLARRARRIAGPRSSVIESGRPAIFTADGPRGPIYQTKMGPIKLAQMTGAPIGAFHLEPEHAWIMNSWDRFLVPKPFTRICVSWAQWTHVPPICPRAVRAQTRRVECAIERARLRALEYFRKAAMTIGSSSDLRVADFDFDLPAELIAQQPPAERGQSRMLVMDRATGVLTRFELRRVSFAASTRRPAGAQRQPRDSGAALRPAHAAPRTGEADRPHRSDAHRAGR